MKGKRRERWKTSWAVNKDRDFIPDNTTVMHSITELGRKCVQYRQLHFQTISVNPIGYQLQKDWNMFETRDHIENGVF
jgi:hypothetical protein